MALVLGESDEVLVVGVHVGELDVHEEQELGLSLLLRLTYTPCHNTLHLLVQPRVARHLQGTQKKSNLLGH